MHNPERIEGDTLQKVPGIVILLEEGETIHHAFFTGIFR